MPEDYRPSEPECFEYVEIYEYGWPTRSTVAILRGFDHPVTEWAVFRPDWMRGTGWPLVLPLRFIWPGFAINTVFYAAILWLLFAAPGFIRRRIRIQRGQCPACAYPVRGGTNPLCTECGAAVSVRTGGVLSPRQGPGDQGD